MLIPKPPSNTVVLLHFTLIQSYADPLISNLLIASLKPCNFTLTTLLILTWKIYCYKT